MSKNDEIQTLLRYVRFEQGEELLVVAFGQVSGNDIDNREGIIFATHLRVGVSAAGGFITSDAVDWRALEAAKSVKVSEDGGIRITCASQPALKLHGLDINDVMEGVTLEGVYARLRTIVASVYPQSAAADAQAIDSALAASDLNAAAAAAERVLARQ
ncbi:MAG: hypothetical protein WCJ30_03315, partial [Deltaproteobacteria bacterium]